MYGREIDPYKFNADIEKLFISQYQLLRSLYDLKE